MGKFTNGVLVGLGISLLVAPRPGKEMRQLVIERFNSLRGTSPVDEEYRPQVPQMTGRSEDELQRPSSTGPVSSVQDYASPAASSLSSLQSNVEDVALQTDMDVLPTSSGSTSLAPSDEPFTQSSPTQPLQSSRSSTQSSGTQSAQSTQSSTPSQPIQSSATQTTQSNRPSTQSSSTRHGHHHQHKKNKH